ncbi:MAG: translation initiation factor [Aminobacterium sp.]|jgi:translation initiation factor 1|uniref:translation initiation factor n=1 Tax=unclassified Aminobacterium TaxID=2685012 RepID=UPI001BCFC8D1|nr:MULTISPECIES: translation initiation factor [unclassified Aminobacterium]MDD2205872.1 translation initiation factor [Aminobacterium sp.]MDD3426303.1 translation initiation factor [Aminobacterium sp.]MDD3706679.1 translation initiation factor [Aminobacterium sp.]MDD4228113.1 translation initiation factor [Aminobacterium sp.]MDD4550858.1 translation initiation factor [Aminobacterium sp.]
MTRQKKKTAPIDNEELYNPIFKNTFKVTDAHSSQQEKKVKEEKKVLTTYQEVLKGKIVLRIERKGRAGKTVTLIETSFGNQDEKNLLAKFLRKQLGCGSSLEGYIIVVQGDQRERIKELLIEEGAKQVKL